MAAFSQSTTAGTTPPYQHHAYYNATTTWAAHRAATANNSSENSGEARVVVSTGSNISRLSRNCLAFDMTIPTYFPTQFPVISAATVALYCNLKDVDATIFPTAANRGLGLVTVQDSSLSSVFTYANYKAAYDAGFPEVATRIPDSSISSSAWVTFTLNAAGIAYLNTMYTKASQPSKAFFNVCLGGDIDNATPSTTFNDTARYGFNGTVAGTNLPVLSITYEPQVQINIADAWRTVVSAKVNVGDTWKTITNWNLNVGDVWKDRE